MTRISCIAFLRSTVSPALVASAFFMSPAYAQPADSSQTAEGASNTTGEDDSSVIVVTGTLFRNANTETASPITVLSSEALQRANITTVAEAIRSISADSTGSISTGFRSGFSAGGSAVSLRGLGVSSTVVLIDGLRSSNFPLSDDGHNSYVDLNSIPFSVVDHVDVLKDGASSLYGADAVGGVVNIITKRHFTGIEGSAQGGITGKGDGRQNRLTLTAGYGDYEDKGFNIYLNGEYSYTGRITNHSRGYPFNTLDLRPSGLADRNRGDDSITTAGPQAVVTRVTQTDLNNPLAGGAGSPLTNSYQLLNPGACPYGTFSVVTDAGIAGQPAATNTGCAHNLPDEYSIIQPKQQRFSFSGRASFRVNDDIEAFVTGSYSNSQVAINLTPQAIRQTQPYGAASALASTAPGIVLPYFICSSGVNCATATDRRLNPNNPYATNIGASQAEAGQNAARIYYLFGDIPNGSERTNEVLRFTGGVTGSFGDGYDFSVQGVYSRNDLSITQHGFINVNGLLSAINTGAYNFVNPELNSQAVRNQVAPDVTTPSYSTLAAIDASLSKALLPLQGGDLQVAIGGQIRRETLNNRTQNPLLDTYNLNTSAASGRRTVAAAFFEIDAPVLDILKLNAGGRFDHYSEGYNRFSPKVGVKFTPIKQISLRGTYSQGFRAPTFAESNPASSYAGFASFTPPASFVAAHPGNAAYSTTYNIGTGSNGNANIGPETSKSLTLGAIFQPTPWLSFTVDYYNIKKTGLIVSGPRRAAAIDAYYSSASSAAGCAAIAAIGPGYACNVIDSPDPQNPGALPRLLILNVPFANANYQVSDGIDYQMSARIPLGSDTRFISRLEVTQVLRQNLVTPEGVVQRYAGTLGPYELSSGGGTPRIRGNWQNTIEHNDLQATLTAYYVGRIKQVAADEITPVNGVIDLSCSKALAAATASQCYIRPFLYFDLNLAAKVNDQARFFFNVQNLFDARAPLAAAAYTSNPNFLVSWHYAGLVGRNFSAGVSFSF